jgi:glycosyltransferase involved in cell wall biosynthesis
VKIVHITLRFDSPGGVETTVREVARRQKAAGDEVEVFASDLVDESGWVRATEFRAEVDGVPVRRFPARKQLLPHLSLPTMVGLVDALSGCGADVLHAHSHRYGHVLQAAAVARREGIPLVVSTHYHPADAWEPAWKKGLLRVEDFGFGASAYRVARALVVESELEARLVGEFSPRERLRVVPPGIALEEWADPDADRAGGPALPADYMLFVGRIASNKGLPTLFDALARLPAAERPPLVLMGPPWGENTALEARARKLGIADRLVWLGQVADRRAYRATLRGARALVLPSAWEAFGLVLLEAMAAKVPIVASAVGAVPEVLEGGRSGRLVPYGDPGALADAIRAIGSEPERTAQAVDRGAARVRSFDWATSVDRLGAVYREATA